MLNPENRFVGIFAFVVSLYDLPSLLDEPGDDLLLLPDDMDHDVELVNNISDLTLQLRLGVYIQQSQKCL
jgi:hypothetical protein